VLLTSMQGISGAGRSPGVVALDILDNIVPFIPKEEEKVARETRKIFATLDAVTPRMNLMFDPDLRDFYMEQAPDAFSPVPGGWGRNGATLCDLRVVDEATLASALQAAHLPAAPKRKAR